LERPAGYRPPPESDLIDEILLAAGKALYLANQFEVKCKFVLTVAYAEEALKNPDSVLALQEELMRGYLATKLSQRNNKPKQLGRILQDPGTVPPGTSEGESEALEKAREARNHIAHETAGAIGDLEGRSVEHMLTALRRLHAEVIDLAKGDYVVSAWAHQITDRKARLWSSVENLEWVEYWVFGHIPQEWLDSESTPDHQPPRTIREAATYQPWYSKGDR
jgi:hypothetical protein